MAGWKENAKDLTAGAAGGIAQDNRLADLVKVRLQTQDGGNALLVARNIWAKEGPLAYYKGSLMPLLGVGACVSVQFGAFHSFQQAIESYNKSNHSGHAPTLSLPQFYLAGPVEHIRIRLQTQLHGAARIYTGPWDYTRKIIRTAGIVGLYRGQAVTLLREIHGYGVWFTVYEGRVGLAMTQQHKETRRSPELADRAVRRSCGGGALVTQPPVGRAQEQDAKRWVWTREKIPQYAIRFSAYLGDGGC
ncbi:hypothetical protein BBP40_007628 [Aspergillus hancockii]|nr:hypothetical protein BBP40_007628 [Aspergillus hancockii]